MASDLGSDAGVDAVLRNLMGNNSRSGSRSDGHLSGHSNSDLSVDAVSDSDSVLDACTEGGAEAEVACDGEAEWANCYSKVEFKADESKKIGNASNVIVDAAGNFVFSDDDKCIEAFEKMTEQLIWLMDHA